MLNLVRKSLQMELHIFKEILTKLGIGKRLYDNITKSAFVQNRIKVSPKVFKFLVDSMNQEFYTDNDERLKTWNGGRILAIDGSPYTLPYSKELIKKYGITQNQFETGVVQARVSVLYDIENKMFLDGLLVPMEIGEREVAVNHLNYCNQNDLIIYDRGYPGFGFILEHKRRNINFLFRCKLNFSNDIRKFVASDKWDDIIEMIPSDHKSFKGKSYKKDTRVTVRLVKVFLNTGEIEVLITTLLDNEKYPIEIFKELYYKRWGIEKGIDVQKNKIQVLNFSGYTDISIQQDFYCALFVGNLQSLLAEDLDEEIKEKYGHRKFDYKINTSISIGILKTKIIELFLSEDPENLLKEIKKILLDYIEPIRPGRNYERKVKYRNRKKPTVTKNYKNNL